MMISLILFYFFTIYFYNAEFILEPLESLGGLSDHFD